MMIDILTCLWSCDKSPLVDRVAQAFVALDKAFPEPTFWEAWPSHPDGPGDRFLVREEKDFQKLGGSLSGLWQTTLSNFSERGMDLAQTSVEACAFSEEMNLAVYTYFSDFKMIIQVEQNWETRVLKDHLAQFIILLKDLGASTATGGWWLRHKSAFAGDPVLLYEPKTPFAKFNDPLRYDEVLDRVRGVRESVRTVVSPEKFIYILQELGLAVEIIPGGRVFVPLGDPMGKGGMATLRKIEQQINLLLKS